MNDEASEHSIQSPERAILLTIAREAVIATAEGKKPPPIDIHALPERLRQPGAAFVTLTSGGNLRGCVGGLQAEMPLAEDVCLHAVAAARNDFRFPPVQPHEVSAIEIEISVLTPLQPISYDSPEDLIQRLQPGVDGVLLTCGPCRATFLPQVWEKIPDPVHFLELLCEKAGLVGDAWRTESLQFSTYQVESFHEGEPSRN